MVESVVESTVLGTNKLGLTPPSGIDGGLHPIIDMGAPPSIIGGERPFSELGTPPHNVPSKGVPHLNVLGARDTSQGVPHYGVLGARVASPGVPHCGVLGARVVCPELDILGQNIRGTTNIQGLNVGEALISHKYGIGGVTGEHKLNETRRHNILTTVMAPISANSETLGEFSEDVRAYSETQGLLVGIACLEGMEMEVHTPPVPRKKWFCPVNA